MSAKFESDGINQTRALLDYIIDASVQESGPQQALRQDTAPMPESMMMVSPEQGQLLGLFARMVRPKRIVEVGTFTGYSATWLAGALEPDGVLVACDISDQYIARAKVHWEAAGLSQKIVPRIGPAAKSLQGLLDEGWAQSVDLIFVDADKTGYDAYYTLGMKLLRPGGVMLFDNVLWSGSVADPQDTTPRTEALRAIVRRAKADPEVYGAVSTIGDGLLAVFKPHS